MFKRILSIVHAFCDAWARVMEVHLPVSVLYGIRIH